MKSLKSSPVDAGEADAGVGSGPSMGAVDSRFNDLDKLSLLGVKLARVLPVVGVEEG